MITTAEFKWICTW